MRFGSCLHITDRNERLLPSAEVYMHRRLYWMEKWFSHSDRRLNMRSRHLQPINIYFFFSKNSSISFWLAIGVTPVSFCIHQLQWKCINSLEKLDRCLMESLHLDNFIHRCKFFVDVWILIMSLIDIWFAS